MQDELKTAQNSEIEEKSIDEKKDNVIPFRLVPGGKEPTDPNDWLSELETGTVFLIKDKNNHHDFNLGQFCLLRKTDKSVMLSSPTMEVPFYVVPRRFCSRYSLHEILGKVEEAKEER